MLAAKHRWAELNEDNACLGLPTFPIPADIDHWDVNGVEIYFEGPRSSQHDQLMQAISSCKLDSVQGEVDSLERDLAVAQERLAAARKEEQQVWRLQRSQRAGVGRGWWALDLNLVEHILAHGAQQQTRKFTVTCSRFRDWVLAVQPVSYLSNWYVDQLLQRTRPAPGSKKVCVLFPGQGTQTVGMGKSLLEGAQAHTARAVYERASEILGYDLLEVCLNGPSAKLDQTQFSQAAVVVTSLAAMAVYEKDNQFHPAMVSGFALGEYTALIYSGAISFDDGIKLVQIRGEAMDAAAKATNGGMVTVIALSDHRIEELIVKAKLSTPDCAAESIQIAYYLFAEPNAGRTLAGNKELCQWFVDNAKCHGAKNVKMLKVAGAFHSEYMALAQGAMQEALNCTQISFPEDCEVFSNVTAQAYRSAQDIRSILPKQLVTAVHWQQTMEALPWSDIEVCIEPGPGQQLRAMLKRIDRDQFHKMISIKVT